MWDCHLVYCWYIVPPCILYVYIVPPCHLDCILCRLEWAPLQHHLDQVGRPWKGWGWGARGQIEGLRHLEINPPTNPLFCHHQWNWFHLNVPISQVLYIAYWRSRRKGEMSFTLGLDDLLEKTFFETFFSWELYILSPSHNIFVKNISQW